MKTLPFTEYELNRLIENAEINYQRIVLKIIEVREDYFKQEHTTNFKREHYDILNRLHQQAMIYSNQVRKYCAMKKIMYSN